MGTQDIREKKGASRFVGEPASLMGTQEDRERTAVEAVPRPFILDGVGMMRMAKSSRKLGPMCAQRKGNCDCGTHAHPPTRTFTPMQDSQSGNRPRKDYEKLDEYHLNSTAMKIVGKPPEGAPAVLMGPQVCPKAVRSSVPTDPMVDTAASVGENGGPYGDAVQAHKAREARVGECGGPYGDAVRAENGAAAAA